MDEDGRNSPPPRSGEAELGDEELGEDPLLPPAGLEQGLVTGHVTMNLLSVVPKEKPPLNVVGDVHGRIAFIVVRLTVTMRSVTVARVCVTVARTISLMTWRRS